MGRRRFSQEALIFLVFWPWLAASGDARESDSRLSAGVGPTMVRLSPFPKPRSIPKTLEGMRRLTGGGFLCVERDDSLIASDLGPGEYEYLVDGVLDYCSAALRRVFFNRGAEAGKMISIFVFRDYASYENGLRRFIGMEPISPYGHYGHSQKYIVINYETGPGTLVHELIHALMSEDFPEAPIWIAEGLASLYEQCRAEGNVLRGDDNWRLPELKSALEDGSLIPLSRLLAMSPADFRNERESLNYAAARYFCKYLEELGILPDVYREFRQRPERDPAGMLFVANALGKPFKTVDAEWRRWLRFQHWRE